MNFIRIIITITFIIGATCIASGQTDLSLSQQDSSLSKTNSENADLYDPTGFYSENAQILELKMNLEQQKTYKLLFLASAVFFLLFGVLIFMFFFRKVSKVHDVTKIHLREIQLRDVRIKNLSILLSYSSNPMLLMDKKGDVKWANSAFLQYKYFSEKDNLEDKNFYADIMMDNAEKEALKRLKETSKAQTIDFKAGGKSVKRNFVPIIETDDSLSGYALIDYEK